MDILKKFYNKRKQIAASVLVFSVCTGALVFLLGETLFKKTNVQALATKSITEGTLLILDKSGSQNICPLKHTDVKAEVSGFISRVTVTQEFENPYNEKIEAVYVFPLPQRAAVDDMTMQIGDRSINGKIKRREEAQAIYEAARDSGQTASLLDQERPNIFTQSIANINSGESIKIIISYVETLKYEDGSYEFVFPMVVGPRYIPGIPAGKQGGGSSPDTNRVPDASRITPTITPQSTRTGHDISMSVTVDAGVPLDGIQSTTHELDIQRVNSNKAIVSLKNKTEIPNKDFVLKYDVAGKKIEDAILTHRTNKDGFFTMLLQPPDKIVPEDVTPKELVFVLDTSGSMEGFPIEKAKETMKLALDGLYSRDTFNLITFAGDTYVLFPKPVPATKENLRKAQAFLQSRSGGGGTEMMTAIRTALEPSDAQDHIRIVCFMTDGYVGNENEIISEVQKHPNARVFSFGIGSSVNRFLLDKMAEYGRGEVEYVTLNDDGSAAARRLHERIRNPLLTDISIDWGTLSVSDIYPQRLPDLFSAKPVILHGRYNKSGQGIIKLKGKRAGIDFVREISVNFPETQIEHDVLATLWARTRIDELMGQQKNDTTEAITQLGLEYKLMTQYTSFVAVEEKTITEGGKPRRIDVPVEMPEGVSYHGIFSGESVKELEADGNSAGISRGTLTTTASAVPINAPPKLSADKPVDTKLLRKQDSKSGNRGGYGVGTGSHAVAQEKSITKNKREESKTESNDNEKRLPQDTGKSIHPAIAALIDRLDRKDNKQSADETNFVKNNKAEIKVFLLDFSPKIIEELKKLGFEVTLEQKSSKLLIGKISIEKLKELVNLKSVRYVTPLQ